MALHTAKRAGGLLCIVAVVWVGGSILGSLSTPGLNAAEEKSSAQQSEPAHDAVMEDTSLYESSTITLDHMRDFWKRENFPREAQKQFQPFSVPPRKDELEYFPCMDCHEDEEINIPEERELTEEHETIKLAHGGERFWCVTCHNLENMDYLRSMKEKRIDFNASYLLCGQCHFQRQKDWFFGGHGKRIGNWNGEKIILLCVECHNPHSPSIKPKAPDPPPLRHRKSWRDTAVNVQPQQKRHRQLRMWEKLERELGIDRH